MWAVSRHVINADPSFSFALFLFRCACDDLIMFSTSLQYYHFTSTQNPIFWYKPCLETPSWNMSWCSNVSTRAWQKSSELRGKHERVAPQLVRIMGTVCMTWLLWQGFESLCDVYAHFLCAASIKATLLTLRASCLRAASGSMVTTKTKKYMIDGFESFFAICSRQFNRWFRILVTIVA
jgi:hypothetical protein